MDTRITKAQIAKIWACAHALGLDRELLYLLVPRGSISAMTREEASGLIEHLTRLQDKRVGPPRAWKRARTSSRPCFTAADILKPGSSSASTTKGDPNAPTQEQRNFIYFLFGKIGWLQPSARMRGFLRKFVGVHSVEDIRERKKAIALIEALKAIHKRQQKTNSI
ncbi:MAG: DUF1018 domain-containing protein [Planctomycetia bacterium]|nr:DUF1018 domain-containing protein [Planctomycetia bacterium]